MSVDYGAGRMGPFSRALADLHANWGWFLAFGIILIILGALAIGLPWVVGLSISILIGAILVGGGLVHMVHAFGSRSWKGFFLSLLIAILYLAIGLLMIFRPLVGAMSLTLLLGVYFTVDGVFKIALAFRHKPLPNWGWILFSGIVALILGVIIWTNWPMNTLWVIGLLVGIDLIFSGWAAVMIALASHAAPPQQATAAGA